MAFYQSMEIVVISPLSEGSAQVGGLILYEKYVRYVTRR